MLYTYNFKSHNNTECSFMISHIDEDLVLTKVKQLAPKSHS